jgi:hypothetical protein
MRQTSTTPRAITAKEACRHADLRALAFTTTADLEPLAALVGQERAMQALHLGLGIPQHGYHIFVSGLASSGAREHIITLIRQRSVVTHARWFGVRV